MPRTIDPERWLTYIQCRMLRMPVRTAARRAGISHGAAFSFERGDESSSGLKFQAALREHGNNVTILD